MKQTMTIVAVAGLVVGIGLGATVGNIGKKKLKKEPYLILLLK